MALSVLLLLPILSCAQDPSPPAQRPLVLRLVKGSCYGTCPTFCVTLRSSGELTYVGAADVAAIGERMALISSEEFDGLVEALQSARFDRWFSPNADVMRSVIQPDGRHSVTIAAWPDVQVSSIEVATASGVRALGYVNATNAGLADFEAAVLRLAEVARWAEPSHTPQVRADGAGPCNQPLQLSAGQAGGS